VRIALSGQFLSQPFTGSGRYTRQLFAGLQDRSGISAEVLGPVGVERPAVRVPTPFDQLSPSLAKVWLEAFGLSSIARRRHADLLHIPYLAGSLAEAPPCVVTAHDAIPFVLPEYRRSPKVRLYNALVATTVRRARLVLTDSTASREDLASALAIPRQRIRVIHLATDPAFSPVAAPGEAEATRRDFGLPEQFLLYLGSMEVRKNVRGLLAAYAQARRRGLAIPLALVARIPEPGGIFSDVHGDLARLGIAKDVILCGPGLPEDTPRLLRGATAFVFPSLYEGFGLPPLEAMACGTPVVCSDRSSLPEVVGDAALLVDAARPDALADAILRLCADDELQAHLSRRGLKRAATFSWQRTVDQTVQAYSDALSL
jgi:glycosyltransferase involved in cell wall biosynthesis